MFVSFQNVSLCVFCNANASNYTAFTAFAHESDVHPHSLRLHSGWKNTGLTPVFSLLSQNYGRNFGDARLMRSDWLRALA